MAHFQPSKLLPQGFDVAHYSMTVPVDNGRYACLFGGGDGGAVLNVVALAGDGGPTAVIKLRQVNVDPKEGASIRRFRVHGLVAGGVSFIHARLPDGRDFSSPLKVTVPGGNTDKATMRKAFDASRSTLRAALMKLERLDAELASRAPGVALTKEGKRMYDAVQTWLKVPPFTPADPAKVMSARTTIIKARTLFIKNLNTTVKHFVRIPDNDFGSARAGDLDFGVQCGQPFFETGPLCQRDVFTHELFHVVGVGHGEAPGESGAPWADRHIVTTPERALNSADNLAQLVAELVGSKTDACMRSA
jgi:hypothetical protein